MKVFWDWEDNACPDCGEEWREGYCSEADGTEHATLRYDVQECGCTPEDRAGLEMIDKFKEFTRPEGRKE